MRTLSVLALILFVAVGVTACGQKGGLYFPQEQEVSAETASGQTDQ